MSTGPEASGRTMEPPGVYGVVFRGAPRLTRLALVLTVWTFAIGFVAVSANPEIGSLGAIGIPLAFLGLCWLPLQVLVPPPGRPRWQVLSDVPVAWREVVERAVAGQGLPEGTAARRGTAELAAWEQARLSRVVLPAVALAVVAALAALAIARGAPQFLVALPLAPVQLVLVLAARRRVGAVASGLRAA